MNTVEIMSIEIILPRITFLILASLRAFLMIKTDCAVHTILLSKWFVRDDQWGDLCAR